jgi:hypothetical protein
MQGAVLKDRNAKELIREFHKGNLGKLGYLPLMDHIRFTKKHKHDFLEWRDILRPMSTLRMRRPKFPFLVLMVEL